MKRADKKNEHLARILCEADGYEPDWWKRCLPWTRKQYRTKARLVIAELKKLGISLSGT